MANEQEPITDLRMALYGELFSLAKLQAQGRHFVDMTLRGNDGYVSVVQPLNRPGIYGISFMVDLKNIAEAKVVRLLVSVDQGEKRGKVTWVNKTPLLDVYGKVEELPDEEERQCLVFLTSTAVHFKREIDKKERPLMPSSYDFTRDDKYSFGDKMAKLPNRIFTAVENK
jgi:hypothetical protein